MKIINGVKLYISVFILLFISFIFGYKYLVRYTDFALPITGLIAILQFTLFRYSDRLRSGHWIRWGVILFSIGLVGLVIISHLYVPIESLQVDRWSVISSFLDEFYAGNYPYYAKSHLGNYPGPMPIYFLIAAPFYWLGELSLLGALGYLIFSFFIFKNLSNKNTPFLLLYLLSSLFMLWEIVTRSNVFTFSVFALLALHLFATLKDKKSATFYLIAILTGVMLSTRSVFILTYIIFFVSNFIKKEWAFKRLFVFVLIAMLSFFATFLPFVLFYENDFFTMNPFIIQSSFLIPKIYTILFMMMALLFSFIVKNTLDKYFYSGLTLFLAILIYSIYHIVLEGVEVAYMNSKIDLSYFIFCIPFLMKCLIEIRHSKVPSKPEIV